MRELFCVALAAAALSCALFGQAQAQRAQSLCKDLVEAINAGTETGEPEIDGTACVRFEGRQYAIDDTEGFEEDAIIGVGSADATLSYSQLSDLETDRVALVPAPGADRYLFVDWVTIIKTNPDGVPANQPSVWIAIAVAPQAGGPIDVSPAIIEVAGGIASNIFEDQNTFVRRYEPPGFGGEDSTENTPLVLGVIGSEDAWNNMIAEVDSDMELRFIVRYRVISTADTF